MDLFNTALEFIKNPDNSWILYSVAAFMIIEAFMLRATSKKVLKLKTNTRNQQPSELKSDISSAIRIAATFSGVFGLLLAAVTFYLNSSSS